MCNKNDKSHANDHDSTNGARKRSHYSSKGHIFKLLGYFGK